MTRRLGIARREPFGGAAAMAQAAALRARAHALHAARRDTPRPVLRTAPAQPMQPRHRMPPSRLAPISRPRPSRVSFGAVLRLPRAVVRTFNGSPIAAALLMLAATLLLVLARQGRVLELMYPVMALAVGVKLFRRHPAHYVGFLCWLIFLTPEVRRLADLDNGAFNPTSPIQVAPLLVAALSVMTLVRRHALLGTRQGLPILMLLAGIFYAYPIGIMRNSPLSATYTLTQWAYPILIGFHIMATRELQRTYERVLMRTFICGTLVMGAYGIVQFFFVPPWDAFWLIGSKIVTEGLPLPRQIRVSSTMNSSAPLALTLMTGLLLLIARPGRVGWLAGVPGFVSLLLTTVRAAWGGWVVGMVWLCINLSNRMRLRVLIAVLALAALAIPMASIDTISEIVSARFETIGSLQNDTSFNERTSFYGSFLSVAFSEIAGVGLGASGDATRLSDSGQAGQQFGSFDSGLMEIPYTLGWSGALLYLGGAGWLLARALRAARRHRHDRVASAWASAALSLFVMLIFLNTLTGTIGVLFFIGAVMPIIGAKRAKA